MRFPSIFLLLTALLPPIIGAASGIMPLPDHIGSDLKLTLVETPQIWDPDTMYEHVNGEAELLKRYGARSLAYAAYENEGGAYLTVDILDMGAPVNAFGLYSLYAGCDGEQYSVSGGTVLSGDYTSYALLGRYFMRIDSETPGGTEKRNPLVAAFLSGFTTAVPVPEPLPGVVDRLKKLARKPCEVSYNPEHVDYDLEAGPGYTWIGPDGGTYFVSFLPSVQEAEAHAAELRNKGVQVVLLGKNAVAWTKAATEESESYLKKALKLVVER